MDEKRNQQRAGVEQIDLGLPECRGFSFSSVPVGVGVIVGVSVGCPVVGATVGATVGVNELNSDGVVGAKVGNAVDVLGTKVGNHGSLA